MLSHLTGIVFDLDGTLVDSALDFSSMRAETCCPDNVGLLEHVDSLESPAQRRAAQAVIHHYEMIGARQATWMPGAVELLQAIRAAGMPMGILTRNSREAARLTLEQLNAPDMPLIAREDARPKPDPDGLLQFAHRWRKPASELAYVGDFRFDMEAARSAGMTAVLYLQADNLAYAEQADLAFSHFEELNAWLAL